MMMMMMTITHAIFRIDIHRKLDYKKRLGDDDDDDDGRLISL